MTKCLNEHDEPTWLTPKDDGSPRYMNTAFERPKYDKYCFECAYWNRRFDTMTLGTCIFAAYDGPFNDVAINMSAFDWNNPLVEPGIALGFAGRLWTIEFLDGRDNPIVKTNDLWYAGDIPERFHWRIKVNARLISV